ncbi:MAG: hypothetical protein ACKVU2_13775 [Saprospiraceae bacterium]
MLPIIYPLLGEANKARISRPENTFFFHSPIVQPIMANSNASKNWTWLLIALIATAGILLVGYLLFPDLIGQLVKWIVGLLLVVTGLVFRKKR